VHTPIIIDQLAFEVTTGPSSANNVRIGIYKADGDHQPVGGPLHDEAIAVASGFTGWKTSAATSIDLAPGVYLA
jgi:hypothetical protein